MTFLSTSVPATFRPAAPHANPNQTNSTRCPVDKMEKWAYDVLQVYILLVSALGILFNLFVLLVFWLHKKPCSVPEIYLSNLAAADLVLVSFLPFWAVSLAKSFRWSFGGAMCRLVNLSIIMNMYCSIYFLVLVSMDRYLALVKPLSLQKLRTAKFAKLGCLLVWALGLLLSVPTLVYREVKHLPLFNITICYLNYPNENALLMFDGMTTIFSFIVPIPIISYCTWKIIQVLNNRLVTEKKEQKATTLILAVLLAFLICWVPFHLVRVIELLYRLKVLTWCRLKAVTGVCKQIFMYLAYFNSVLNPILYVIVGKNFQKKVKEVFYPSAAMRHVSSSTISTRTYIRSLRRSLKSETV